MNTHDVQKKIIDDIIGTSTIINGIWDPQTKVWTYRKQFCLTLILNYAHAILDPDNKLTRSILYENVYASYCYRCKVMFHDCSHMGHSITRYTEYLRKHNMLNYIENIIVKHYPYFIPTLIDTCNTMMCTKSRQIHASEGMLTLLPVRTKEINCHIFVDYEINQTDVNTYNTNPNSIDLLLLELFQGNMESYKRFMGMLTSIHYHQKCMHFIIECNDNTQILIRSLFMQLYKRFVRSKSNMSSGYIQSIRLYSVHNKPTHIHLPYFWYTIIMVHKDNIPNLTLRNVKREIYHIKTNDVGITQLPSSTITKIVLDIASHKYDTECIKN